MQHRAKTPPTTQHRTSGADTCTVKRNGYEGHACIDLVTGRRRPKTHDTRRRRPHVPSSKPTMSKNHPTEYGGQPTFPDFKTGGPGVRLSWRPASSPLESG